MRKLKIPGRIWKERPRKRCMDVINEEMEIAAVTKEMAINRTKWRNMLMQKNKTRCCNSG